MVRIELFCPFGVRASLDDPSEEDRPVGLDEVRAMVAARLLRLVIVTVLFTFIPALRDAELGLAAMEKSALVTTNAILSACESEPLTPVTVTR